MQERPALKIDVAGKPVADAAVSAAREYEGSREYESKVSLPLESALTDSDGTFVLHRAHSQRLLHVVVQLRCTTPILNTVG